MREIRKKILQYIKVHHEPWALQKNKKYYKIIKKRWTNVKNYVIL